MASHQKIEQAERLYAKEIFSSDRSQQTLFIEPKIHTYYIYISYALIYNRFVVRAAA